VTLSLPTVADRYTWQLDSLRETLYSAKHLVPVPQVQISQLGTVLAVTSETFTVNSELSNNYPTVLNYTVTV
jgi:hypothetical protein